MIQLARFFIFQLIFFIFKICLFNFGNGFLIFIMDVWFLTWHVCDVNIRSLTSILEIKNPFAKSNGQILEIKTSLEKSKITWEIINQTKYFWHQNFIWDIKRTNSRNEIKISLDKSNGEIFEIKTPFQNSKGQILEIKNSLVKSNRQILEIKTSIKK